MASAMQFWGVEVKPKETCTVPLEGGSIIHISQATLSEIKKDKETVIVHVKVGETKLVMGLLSQDTPQLSCDLVFESDFEISHNWKNGSIHLMGYKAETPEQGDDFESSDEEEEDVVPVAKENGQLKPAVTAPAGKPKVDNKPKPVEKDDNEEDDSSDDEDFEEGDSDEEMALSDSDDDGDDSEDSEDEKPVITADASKKRPNPAAKTPEPKKAKIVATPSKSDSKKGVVHPATPHPKKEGKTPAENKSDSKKGAAHTATPHPKKGEKTPAGDRSPKSAGDVACGSCKKTFKSEGALQSHSKAKHGAN